MNTDETKKTNEYLQTPGVSFSPETVYVERYPLSYFPGQTTELNRARLPEESSLSGMDLAYRQQRSISAKSGMATINIILLWSLIIPLVLTIIPLFVEHDYFFLYAGPILSALLLIVSMGSGRMNFQRAIPILILPTAGLYGFYWIGTLLQHRLMGGGIFAIISLLLLVRYARFPFEFYNQWAHTHPRLKPETRRATEKIKSSPDYLVVILVLAVGLGVSYISVSLAILITLVLLIAFASPAISKTNLKQLRKVLGIFASYRSASQAPGVWQPAVPTILGKRIKKLPSNAVQVLLIVFPLAIALATAFSLYGPYDMPGIGLQNYVENFYLSSAHEHPSSWIRGAQSAMMYGYIFPLWLLPLALTLAFVIPSLLILAFYRNMIKESLEIDVKVEGYQAKDGSSVRGLDDDGRTEWQWYLDRVRSSEHEAVDPMTNIVREADHLFLGIEPHADIPVYLDSAILKEHCYIVGETGSGKTALGVIPILAQLIRGHKRANTSARPTEEDDPAFASLSATDSYTPCPPIVILDLKGDSALFHSVRDEAKSWADRTGRELQDVFQFFTPEPQKATYRFNPLSDFLSGERSLPQLTQLLLDSLALSHGEGYGRSYYTRRNRQLLNAALIEAKAKDELPKDIAGLYKLVEHLARTRSAEFKDAFELISTLHSLSQYDAITHNPSLRRHTIHMPSVLQERQIAYFWLPAAIESVSVRELGKMAIFALISAAIDRQHTGKPYRQAYLVIDEFQRLTGENFKVILEQARSFGVANILANQTQGDLKTPDTDLRPTIMTNTRAKFYFSLSDPDEVLALSQASGEEVAYMRSHSIKTTWATKKDPDTGMSYPAPLSSETQSWAQSLKPRIIRNDVLRVSDHPLEFMLQVSRGSGYTQFGGVPVPVRTTYPYHKAQYEDFLSRPWPSLEEIPELTKESEPPQAKEDKADELRVEWNRRFESDFRKLQGE